ncbi:hypothetical protein LX36DRAFT_225568 [Colletotrichum falcatum]|nr:hypothetical protein LX36DRAFT_225568 [Colletotrichum falcatum]
MMTWIGFAWKTLIVCWRANERLVEWSRTVDWYNREVLSAFVGDILIYACYSPESTACLHGRYYIMPVRRAIASLAFYRRKMELLSCYRAIAYTNCGGLLPCGQPLQNPQTWLFVFLGQGRAATGPAYQMGSIGFCSVLLFFASCRKIPSLILRV